jgi:hypothetical protein
MKLLLDVEDELLHSRLIAAIDNYFDGNINVKKSVLGNKREWSDENDSVSLVFSNSYQSKKPKSNVISSAVNSKILLSIMDEFKNAEIIEIRERAE